MRRREWLELAGLSLASSVLRGAFAHGHREDFFHAAVATPHDLSTPTLFFDRLITPNGVFFVRSHFGPPALDPSRRIKITGLVSKPIDVGMSDLKGLPEVTLTAVLQCAGNGRALHEPRVPGVQWVHGAMGQAAWTGVRLRDLLDRAGLSKEAKHVHLSGADLPPKPSVPKYLRSIPLARALDPTTIVAHRMNGEPLSLAHGAPFRLVVPGWAGDHWVKWLTELRLEKEEAQGFYMQTAYKLPKDPVAPGAAVPPEQMVSLTTFPVKSLIALPEDNGFSKAGPQEVSGIAFSGVGAIAKVEISIDGGPFQAVKLEGDPGVGRWQVFRHRFEASPGKHSAVVRATDDKGNAQPEKASWNPSGYFWNAWHRVSWQVFS